MTVTPNPRLLFFDIETTPSIFAGYHLGKQHVAHDQILKNPEVMCISWAWDDGKVQHDQFDLKLYDWYEKDDRADYAMIKRWVSMASDADMVIGHNGKFFDVAFLRSRIVKYKLLDFQPTLIDDTYLQSKSIGFLSHKLDYLSDYLGHGRKEEHGHGMEWWISVMRGDDSILKKMIKYCDGDVIKLRSIYKDLKPYIKSNLNRAMWFNRPDACPSCGQSERPLIIRKYNQKGQPILQCPICNKYPFTKGKTGLNKKESGHTQSEYNR